eukprot:CAMPEP_0118957038 /NCGR_PEP_ID=MMETSP1169-20130426/61892_1 /TAXON_ID=36882 /ORGANISM="Pyramimonas obovata, Strain CCMP722" /LENGTH=423 /DNA_ID=CAMNT_0006905093 /DNA_START=226 /DNA_END=1497 /DNA_ORIENTATION=+
MPGETPSVDRKVGVSDKDKIIAKDYSNRSYFVRKVSQIPEPMVGLALGIASMSTLYNNTYEHLELYGRDTADIVAGLFALSGALVIFVYSFKAIYCWSLVAKCFYCPTDSAVFPVIGMVFMTGGAGIQPFAPKAAQGLWYTGLVLYTGLTANFFYRNRRCHPWRMSWTDIRDTTVPLLMIPFVGIELGTVSSKTIDVTFDDQDLATDFIGEACFMVGTLGALCIMPPTMARLFFGEPLSDAAMPTIFIMMAPKYLMLAAWLTNHPTNATGTDQLISHLLFVCGAWSYLYTHYKVIERAWSLPGHYIPFKFTFASFTFPLDAVAIALMKYYGATKWKAAKYIATFVFGEANLVLFLVLLRVGYAGWQNLSTPDIISSPPCLMVNSREFNGAANGGEFSELGGKGNGALVAGDNEPRKEKDLETQ